MYNLSEVLKSAKAYSEKTGLKLETRGLEDHGSLLRVNFIDEEKEIDTLFAFSIENYEENLLLVRCFENGQLENFDYFEDVESAINWCF